MKNRENKINRIKELENKIGYRISYYIYTCLDDIDDVTEEIYYDEIETNYEGYDREKSDFSFLYNEISSTLYEYENEFYEIMELIYEEDDEEEDNTKSYEEIKERIEKLEEKIGYTVSYYTDGNDDVYTVIENMLDPESLIYNNQIADYIRDNFNTVNWYIEEEHITEFCHNLYQIVNYVHCEEQREELEKYEDEIQEIINLVNELNELEN